VLAGFFDSRAQLYDVEETSMPDTTSCNAASILNTWIRHKWAKGLQVGSVPDFTIITVQTRNTTYEITVIDGETREVLIRGGKFFPVRTEARLAGSSMGGSFLKIGGIYAGFNMEILAAGTTVVTTPVQSIRVYS
jgi:hypothetical protein